MPSSRSQGTDRETAPVAPSLSDRFARLASGFIGGPLGGHAVDPPRRRFWTPLRVILFTGLLFFAVSWLQKYPCAGGGWLDWQQYTNACYTDIRALWGVERLNEGAVPYRDHPVEYPVLTGWFMGVLGQIAFRVGNVTGLEGGTIFYHLNALTLFGCGVAAIAILYAIRADNRRTEPLARDGLETPPSRPSRPWDAMMLAAAPVVLVTATVNWDLFAVALSMPFFLYWQRSRPVAAGLFLGLAVAAKFYALLFIGPLLVLALRQKRLLPALTATATAALTWAAINAPVAALWQDSWLRFFELNSERPVDWGTGWYVVRGVTGWERLWDHEFVNDAYLVLFALACVGIAALGYFTHRRAAGPIDGSQASPRGDEDVVPRLAQLCFLVVAAFLLFGKVWSQQYVLWLIPLAVLARPKWTMFLVWQAAELFYFISFYGKMLQVSAEDGRGIPEWAFLAAASTRWLTVAAMCALVVWEILNPRLDAVRGLRPPPTRAVPTQPPRGTADPAPAAAP